MHEAMFWAAKDGSVQCKLCNRHCIIAEGKTGICRVRKNVNGVLQSLVFAKPCSINVDDIEKKPFYHFAPGTRTLSVATVGCNFFCKYCQNVEISKAKEIFGEDVEPAELATMGKNYPCFSWTYTEPTVFAEYFYETAKLTKGKYHTWVTNGYTTEEALKTLGKYIDAVNVDYKGNDKFYKDVCSAELEPVRKALKLYKKLGVWIEITNLLVPGYNTDNDVVKEMVSWIAENLGADTPLHISRYHPHHEMTAPATTLEQLERAAEIAEQYLDFVYIGNIANDRMNTKCPNCSAVCIERAGKVKINLVKKGDNYVCPECGCDIPVIMTDELSLNRKSVEAIEKAKERVKKGNFITETYAKKRVDR